MILSKVKKNIPLYIITDYKAGNSPEEFSHILTITSSKKEAYEFIDVITKQKYKDHYLSWCTLKGVDYNQEITWQTYSHEVLATLPNPPAYWVSKLKYSLADIAIVFRMFNGCLPIGCSFDSKPELDRLIAFATKVSATPTTNNIL